MLEWEIESFENRPSAPKKQRRRRVFVNDDQFSHLQLNYGECKVSDIANEINRVIADNGTKKMQAAWINDWLESRGMMTKNADGN